ncbi:xanthine dehydrogenase family protein molybdopterin-binding subunit [Kibdelosporangium phytohabitans]|uniref:Carbon monoxide dehydrogenase n=1 Tax=Kibdelosporangium phytohabitans TaxID=860235 RepID=A0A0N9I513_9PSEU|nr:molybdopterin cofactor-binding domain-containing protein [Kibdelosporangium phytohabitans]ALG09673.1 carbon monoxide dehydrogenase [Kibdelosporangium phytohabitans]MBE1468980.1 xanthine dehydrogenase D subunit [Kibdelosporangium phytohabitans]
MNAAPDGIGTSAKQPDGVAKVTGVFRFSSDLGNTGAVWAATLRSPHAHARVLSIDTAPAWQLAGVRDVITHADIPGRKLCGQMKVDQPVLAEDVVRFHGEPVAVVAADDLATARLAAERIVVDYEVLPAVTDPLPALEPGAPAVHPDGNVVAHKRIRRGAAQSGEFPYAEVVVKGEYTVGMQDPAFLGPESGLAVPTPDGGVELHVATQWLHVDQEQIAASLGLASDLVVVKPAGTGGAFGGREDLTVHVHACLIALRLQRPVMMSYSRAESFLGHVHRHPAVLRYEHGCTADGKLVYVRAEIVLDGGAYAASSPAIAGNAATHAVGPYDVPHVWAEATAVYTNNPPAGAMRGFGTVQPCFAYESQMDRLAAVTGLDPVEFRLRNALRTGGSLPTGQVLTGPVAVTELLQRLRALPVPAGTPAREVVRGVGYAVCLKNIGFSEGFDDFSTARVRLCVDAGSPVAVVTSAAMDVGQGVSTVQRQIAVSELGVADVRVEHADSRFGTAGPTSASRHTYVTGGAVRAACQEVRADVLKLARERFPSASVLRDGVITDSTGDPVATLADVLGSTVIERTAEFHHPRTYPLDPVNGQGDSAMQFGFAAHRAVVDVDVDLGQVTVVDFATAQDVGRVMNPLALAGQLQGGAAQGLGLALMEELHLADGQVLNPSFATYMLPTMMDVPPLRTEILEMADPRAPYGVRGIGELPAISSTAAVAAAVRAATGKPVNRVPIRPEHLLDLEDL